MNFFGEIIRLVRKVPRRHVATYGQIAALAGHPRSARTVGWSLHSMSGEGLRSTPWHRVVNREGRISTTCQEHSANLQAALLKKEEIEVEYRNGNYYVDLKKYLWKV